VSDPHAFHGFAASFRPPQTTYSFEECKTLGTPFSMIHITELAARDA